MAKARTVFTSATFFFLTALPLAQIPTVESKPHHKISTATIARPCLVVDSEVIPDCIHETSSGKLFIAPQYVKKLHFDSAGLAAVWSNATPYEWMYVDRRGAVVVRGVPSFENLADEFSEGLVRTVIGEKYGYADRHGRIAIKPVFDGASPFQNGYAQVCNGCREMCMMPGGAVEIGSVPGGCDHRIWVGGAWFKIDKKGRIVAKVRR